jgi:hypothetical protein
VPLGNQSVLLAGVNDSVHIQRKLVHDLVKIRVRPYYLYQCDLVEGSGHLRTTVSKGIEIIEGLRGHTSGYAVPQYVVDAPGGGGKIPVMPNYVISHAPRQGRPAQLRRLHHHLRSRPTTSRRDAAKFKGLKRPEPGQTGHPRPVGWRGPVHQTRRLRRDPRPSGHPAPPEGREQVEAAGDRIIIDAVAPAEKGKHVMTWVVEGNMCYPYIAIVVE